MGKTSSAAKARYNAKAYDRLAVTVPKGRKAAVEGYAQQLGQSVNGMINDLLRRAIGMAEDEWKAPESLSDGSDAG